MISSMSFADTSTPVTAAVAQAEGSSLAFGFEVETRASGESVWKVWTDVDAWPTWDTELESARIDSPFGEGATGALKSKGSPEATFRIEGVVAGSRYRLVTKLPLGGRLIVDRSLTQVSAGTRFRHDVKFEGFGGWVLSKFLSKGFRKALPKVMHLVATRAEQFEPLSVTK